MPAGTTYPNIAPGVDMSKLEIGSADLMYGAYQWLRKGDLGGAMFLYKLTTARKRCRLGRSNFVRKKPYQP